MSSYQNYPIQGLQQPVSLQGFQGYPIHQQQQQQQQQQLLQQQQQQQMMPPPNQFQQAHNTLITPSNLAQMQQQGYAQQQQHLAAMQAAQAQAHAAAIMRPAGRDGPIAGQLHAAQLGYQGAFPQGGGPSAPPPKKKRGPKPAQQMIPPPARPLPTEHYVKQAVAPPPQQSSLPQGEIEPWADALDELDPRELAMARFRARQEVLAEIFSPDPIKNIPLLDGDAWQGFGLDGETLEDKVTTLEKENEELESQMDEQLESWRKKLSEIETMGEIAVS